jgi:hypothetical protein
VISALQELVSYGSQTGLRYIRAARSLAALSFTLLNFSEEIGLCENPSRWGTGVFEDCATMHRSGLALAIPWVEGEE